MTPIQQAVYDACKDANFVMLMKPVCRIISLWMENQEISEPNPPSVWNAWRVFPRLEQPQLFVFSFYLQVYRCPNLEVILLLLFISFLRGNYRMDFFDGMI